jgi:hypothetical protein
MEKNKKGINKDINIFGAITTPYELMRETTINYLWGFMGNSVVVFMAKGIDSMVILNFLLYYIMISYIVNRDKYQTTLGKFIVLPGSAALGAYSGYKIAQYITFLL